MRHRDSATAWLLELAGEADIATWGLLRQELAQMAAMRPAAVVVDVTRLAFCDVASAELLLMARRTRPVTVVGATGTVERVFTLLETLQLQCRPRDHAVGPTPGRPSVRALLAV